MRRRRTKWQDFSYRPADDRTWLQLRIGWILLDSLFSSHKVLYS